MWASQSGCVTSKRYRMAKGDVVPAPELRWTTTAGTAELTLTALIVYQSPGSWKRVARWDEYIVRVGNSGESGLVIDRAELTDLDGDAQSPGDDPWRLERLSLTNWDKYGKRGLQVLAGAGAVAVYGAATYASAMGSIMSGGAAAGGAALLTVIPIVAAVDITAVVIINRRNRRKVEAEFNRRRLALPCTIEPGSSAEGSLFFPMTPGPQRLTLYGWSDAAPIELELDLSALAGLHLKPALQKGPDAGAARSLR